MKPSFRYTRLGGCLALVALVSACAQMYRNEADKDLREGRYEAAIAGLQDGLKQYPDSTLLRAGLLTAREDAVARLIDQAIRERAAGKMEAASQTLTRAKALAPGNQRLTALELELDQEESIRAIVAEARALASANQHARALSKIEAALHANPRQPALLAVQRQLEAGARTQTESSGRRALAESRPVSLDFRGAPLSTLLDAITRGSGVNFILDKDVKTETRSTIFIKSAPLEEAIDLVAGSNQLARRTIDSKTVLLYPNTPEKRREHQEQVIRVFYLAHAEAKATAALLKGLLRIKEVFLDERANFIALREPPEIVSLAERLVALHDVGDAEVMLEVEVLEIKSSRLLELGVNFPNSFTLTPLGSGSTTGAGLTVNGLRNINSSQVGVSVGSLLVNLRREVGDFNTLANPRIRTRNREKAKILIGDKIPVITSTASPNGFVSESINYLDVGLKLEVEPVVSPDDEVLIKLGLEVSSLAREIRTTGGSLAYQIGTRNASTTLRLKDGETQLLAGLISNEDRTNANKIPGLGDLPVAGRLFSSQKDEFQRTELVLAITPRILRPAPRPEIWQSELWVGTENDTRLRPAPSAGATANSERPSTSGPGRSVGAPRTLASREVSLAPQGTVGAQPRATAIKPGVTLAWQGPTKVQVGKEFELELRLSSHVPLNGFPLEVVYAPQTIEIVEVIRGSYFGQQPAEGRFAYSINKDSGKIGVSSVGTNNEGQAGEGSVLRLKVRAKEAGTSEIKINGFAPFGPGLVPPAAPPPATRIQVSDDK
ncbi:MAG: general secretion pathway protein GspD [Ramlibacter sp.]|nr:general secretion pathway protein GspD [Ramlibacter sp.]